VTARKQTQTFPWPVPARENEWPRARKLTPVHSLPPGKVTEQNQENYALVAANCCRLWSAWCWYFCILRPGAF